MFVVWITLCRSYALAATWNRSLVDWQQRVGQFLRGRVPVR